MGPGRAGRRGRRVGKSGTLPTPPFEVRRTATGSSVPPARAELKKRADLLRKVGAVVTATYPTQIATISQFTFDARTDTLYRRKWLYRLVRPGTLTEVR